jgi:hypothetical protein
MADSFELGFTIKGYPGTERRVEQDSDLSRVWSMDLIQGAFMGDATFKINATDFSTQFGWVTLIDWCLRITSVLRTLEREEGYSMRFSESDDFISFRILGSSVLVACSYRPGIAVAQYDAFVVAVQEFVVARLKWIYINYPGAFANPAMGEALGRVGISFPK